MSHPPGQSGCGAHPAATPLWSSSLQLEEIVECLPCVVDARGGGFPLDRSAGGVKRAGVALVLRRHAGGNRLHALEAAAGIERRALGAGVQLDAALGAPA